MLPVVACALAFARIFEPFGLNKIASLCEFLTSSKAVCASRSVLYGPTMTMVVPPERIARAGRPSLRKLEASFSARDGALKLPTATRYERRYVERDGFETLGFAWTTRGGTGFATLMVGVGRGAGACITGLGAIGVSTMVEAFGNTGFGAAFESVTVALPVASAGSLESSCGELALL